MGNSRRAPPAPLAHGRSQARRERGERAALQRNRLEWEHLPINACAKASRGDEQDTNSHKCLGKTGLSNKIGKIGVTLASLPYVEVRENCSPPLNLYALKPEETQCLHEILK